MNRYPHGKISSDDEGELTISVGNKDADTIIIHFGKPVTWIGLNRAVAQELGLNLLRRSADRHVSMELPD